MDFLFDLSYYVTPAEYIIIGLFPVVGLILHLILEKRIVKKVLLVSTLAFLPAIFRIDFFLSWFYEVSFAIVLGSLFALCLKWFKKKAWRIAATIIVAVLLSVFLGFSAVLRIFIGTIEIEDAWNADKYRVEYVREQGFSGGALMRYELYRTYLWGMYERNVDTWVNHDYCNDCVIHFRDRNLSFDKCEQTIKTLPQNAVVNDCTDSDKSNFEVIIEAVEE